ncbi:MAG: uroporphyrinogen-III synthase [Paracoccaceae bacterium]
MSETAPVVLLTRPAVPAARFRKMLGRGADVILSPVTEIEPVAFKVDLSGYRTLIIASQHAVQSMKGVAGLSGKQAFAVGEHTAMVAGELGLAVVASDANADDLVARIIAERPPGKFLFVRGVRSRGDIENRLENRGLETDSIITYNQIELPLSARAIEVLRGARPVVLPLFSPRSAELMARKSSECSAAAPLILIAMSAAVLAAWDGPVAAYSMSVDEPTAQAMAEETLRRIRGLP